MDDWRGAQLAEARALIRAADPQVEEQWKWMGTPTFAHDGIYAIANPHKGKVKITFGHGAELPDPYGLFNAGLGGKKWRAIDLFEGDRLNNRAFKQLVRAAVKENVAREGEGRRQGQGVAWVRVERSAQTVTLFLIAVRACLTCARATFLI